MLRPVVDIVAVLFLAQIHPGIASRLQQARENAIAGRYGEAIALYNALAREFPADPRPFVGLGSAEMGAHRPAEAIPPLRRALSLLPGQPQTSLLLAQALAATGAYEDAAAEFRSVIDEQPSSAPAWYGLGRVRVAQAGDSYRQLVGAAPQDSPWVLAIVGDSLMRRLQYRQAIMSFREALAKDPSLVSARAALAEIYQKLGRPDWAKKEQADIAALDCSVHHIECDATAGRLEAVIASANGRTPAALYWRGQAYAGLANEAFARLQELPPSPESHRYQAGLYWEAGRALETAQELRAALEMTPGDREARLNLAEALGAAGSYDEALQHARQLLRSEPDSAQLNALAGEALLGLENAEEAIPFLRKSVTLDQRNLVAQSSLGRAYMLVGEAGLALPHLQAAAPMDTTGSVHHLLARALQQSGQSELARKAMAKYEELSAHSAPPPANQDIPPP